MNQIFDKILDYNLSDYKILIITTLCIIISSTYYFHIKRKIAAKVSPKQILIIQDTSKENSSTKDDKDFDISSCGGLIPCLRKLHEIQGPHVLSKLPFPNTISVVDPIIMKRTLSVGDRPTELFKFLEPLIGEDNFQIFDASRAAKFRELIGPAFGHETIAAKYQSIRDVCLEFIESWEKLVMNDKDSVIKMQDECLKLSLRIGLVALMSIDDSKDYDPVSYKKSYDIAMSGLFDKQIGILDELRDKEFQQAIEYLKSFTGKLIDQRKKKLSEINDDEKNHVKDLSDILLSENDPHTEKPFTNEMIISLITTFTMAGYHSTGIAIPHTLLALSQNYDVQRKLQEEIDEKLEGRLPTFDDLSKMEYLTQVVKESLRIYTAAGFCARMIKSEKTYPTMIESKDLPVQENTTIIYSVPLYHENPEFHPEPEKFDPSRFSSGSIKNIKPNTFIPFGFGARICPAERLAMVDIKMVICMIMQKFNVELAMKLEDFVREERFAIMAKNDILIKLIPRDVTKK